MVPVGILPRTEAPEDEALENVNRSVRILRQISIAYEVIISAPVRRNKEESGSDVNLATYLLLDGFKGDYEQAVIISNDSDRLVAIQVVRNELGLHTGILNPQKNRNFALAPVPDFYRPIRKGPSSAGQFSPTLFDSQGSITKPVTW